LTTIFDSGSLVPPCICGKSKFLSKFNVYLFISFGLSGNCGSLSTSQGQNVVAPAFDSGLAISVEKNKTMFIYLLERFNLRANLRAGRLGKSMPN
jgi:hypothetical protein